MGQSGLKLFLVAGIVTLILASGGCSVDVSGALAQSRVEGESCTAMIAPFEASFTPLPPIQGQDGCGAPAPFSLSALGKSGRMKVRPQATVNCPLTAALAKWERQVVQPAAKKYLGQNIVEIRQFASYVCRTRNNKPGARLSEHSLANALDIGSFTLASGRIVTVKEGWVSKSPDAEFLRYVHYYACPIFGTVLGPEANALHRDHFHLDLGRGGVCE